MSISLSGIFEWGQVLPGYNWRTFHPVCVQVDDDSIMGSVELTVIVLGIGLRVQWVYKEQSMDSLADALGAFQKEMEKSGFVTTKLGDVTSFTLNQPPTTQAIVDVIAERRRQVEKEGNIPAKDDTYLQGELTRAALCYLWAVINNTQAFPAGQWPWGVEHWKPKPNRRMLVIAGALILAEIDRRDREGGQDG